MRTINRNPMSVKQLGYNDIDYKFFTQADWKGINEDENVVTVDPETFAEAENVYINEDGILKSRPSITSVGAPCSNLFSANQIIDLDNYIISNDNNNLTGTSLHKLGLYITNKQTGEQYNYNPHQSNETFDLTGAIELNKSVWIFLKDVSNNKDIKFVILQFVKSTHEFITDNNIYIPTTKIYQNGLELTSAEEENLLTNKVKTVYNYIKTDDYTVRDYLKQYFNSSKKALTNTTDVIINKDLESKKIEQISKLNDLPYLSQPITNVDLYKTSKDDYYVRYNADKKVLIYADFEGLYLNIHYTFDFGKTIYDVPKIHLNFYVKSNVINLYLSEDGGTIFVISQSKLFAYSILPNEAGVMPYETWTDVINLYKNDTSKYTDISTDIYTNVYAKSYDSFMVYWTSSKYDENEKKTKYYSNVIINNLTYYEKLDTPIEELLPETIVNNNCIALLMYYSDITNYSIMWKTYDANIEPVDNTRTYSYYLVSYNNDTTSRKLISSPNLRTDAKGICNNYLIYINDKPVFRLNYVTDSLSGGSHKYYMSSMDIAIDTMKTINILFYYIDNMTDLCYINEFGDRIYKQYDAVDIKDSNDTTLYTVSKVNVYNISKNVDLELNFYSKFFYVNSDYCTYFKDYKSSEDLATINIYSLYAIETANIININLIKYITIIDELYNLTLLNNVFASDENNLYINAIGAYYKDDKDYIYEYWYFPKIKKQIMPSNIKYLHVISNTTVAIFMENSIYYTIYDSNVSAYRYYKSKIPLGAKSNIITTYDGKYTLFITEKGLAALTYQDFVSNDEQTLTFLSDTIYSRFTKMFNTNAKVFDRTDNKFKPYEGKIIRYKYWILCYLDISNIFLFDTRNNSWWYFKIPINCISLVILENGEHVEVHMPSFAIVAKELMLVRGIVRKFTTDVYYDKIENKIQNIDWRIKSQKLYLSSINYYKHIVNITLNTALDSNKPALVTLKVKNYRKRADYGKNILGKNKVEDTISFNVDIIRTFVKRLNYYKINAFEYELSNFKNDNDVVDIDAVPLSLTAISIKYLLTGQVR